MGSAGSTRRNVVTLAVACAVIAAAGTFGAVRATNAPADANAVVPNGSISGFTPTAFPGNDDGTVSSVPLGFDINFFGTSYGTAYVNNNGNITFDGPLA